MKKLLERKEKALNETRAKIDSCNSLEEAKTLQAEARSLENEIAEIRAEIEKEGNENPEGGESRSAEPAKVVTRKNEFNLSNPAEKREEEDVRGTLEYRQAFAEYVRTGKWNLRGTDAYVGTADIGKVIPTTIMNEFIKNIKAYGQLYAKVRKTNVKGGVEYPIEDLVPTVSWIAEGVRSDEQKAPELKTSVAFNYYIAEARIAQSLLAEVVSLSSLETEIANLLAEAFVKEFDNIIINGSGTGKPLGILNDTGVAAANKLTFTAAEIADWTNWRKKLFKNVPLACRNRGIFVMTAATWESNIMTLKDSSNRPLYTEALNAQTGNMECRLNGKEVILVENDVINSFDDATDGQAFAVFFDPQQYAFNFNQQLGFKRWFDEDKNKWINKGLCVCDGKLLSKQSCFILKKSVPATL